MVCKSGTGGGAADKGPDDKLVAQITQQHPLVICVVWTLDLTTKMARESPITFTVHASHYDSLGHEVGDCATKSQMN
jgi:hypothetical protein